LQGVRVLSWIRLDDGFADHPKIKRAGPLAIAAQVRALCYSARFLTNGHLPAKVVDEILADLAPLTLRDMCLQKLWQKSGRGYLVHDYLAYNPDRRTVTELRETRARAGRLGGMAKALADATARANGQAITSQTRPLTTESKKNSREIVSRQWADLEERKQAARELLKRAGFIPPAAE
jgi:hypothetical protein